MNKKNIIIVLIVIALLWFIYKKFFAQNKVLKDAFQNLQFETNKAVIKNASFPYLDELYKTMVKSNWNLKLIGHTDNVGKNSSNLVLSKKRAEAVKEYLVNLGIAPDRIKTEGRGEAEPIASNDNEEGRAKNRRVEFIIEKLLM